MTDLNSFLVKLHENLNILREREAKYAGNAPLELLNQINDHQEAIVLTEQRQRGELSEIAWQEALRPLLVAIQARTTDSASSVTMGDVAGGIQHSLIVGRDVNQITVNVVTLLGRSLTDQSQPLPSPVQAILNLVLAQVNTIDARTAQKYPANPLGYQAPLSDALAELLQTDPGLAARLDVLSGQFYSCFISYSHQDEVFAQRLHADLEKNGVRCWFAPQDMKIGDKIRPTIDRSIQVHDKLLLILSEHSISSDWVEKEVETAFEKEHKYKQLVLFPIQLDSVAMETDQAWAADIRRTRHIGDFSRWKDHDAYQQAFERLLRDLQAEE
jgi:hypothetical protein